MRGPSAALPFRLEEATIDELHAAIRAGQTTCVGVVQRYLSRARDYNGVASLLVSEDGVSLPEAATAEDIEGVPSGAGQPRHLRHPNRTPSRCLSGDADEGQVFTRRRFDRSGLIWL